MAKGQLNAGSLGGRFLRRTIPQKGKSVPSRISEHDAMAIQAKQALPDGNRRVRTSAAMIGLAVSVGAYGLPLPHQRDQVAAAEPASADPAASNVSTSFETAAVLPVNDGASTQTSAESGSLPIRHTVQEGQTLWDVARFYGVSVSSLATANGLEPTSVLRVGQILNVSVDTRIAQALVVTDSAATPGYYGPVSNWRSADQTVASLPNSAVPDFELKANQSKALETLKQKRENLRSGLASLNQPSEVTPQSRSNLTTSGARPERSSVPTVIPSAQGQSFQQQQASNLVEQEQAVALRSPDSLSPGLNSVGNVTHQVVPGDTLSTIARANGVSVRELLHANRITDPNYIFVGQTIVIPGQRAASMPQEPFSGAIAAVPSSTVVDVPSSNLSRRSTVLPAPNSTADAKVVAVSPFTTLPQAAQEDDSTSRILQYNHVENLKREIDQLRERHQLKSNRSQVVVRTESKVAASTRALEVAPAPVSEPVNPEFNPDRYSVRLREIRDRIRPGDRTQSASVPTQTPAQNSQQLVAVAPLGSESYDPIKSRLGRTVSPELPSLGTGSEFLPSAPGQVNGGYIWPTRGVLTSGYGWRWGRMHKGIDIAGPIGTPIVAAAEGRVSYAGWNSGGYGYLVEIQHPDGSLTLYAHNNRILVQVGQEVEQGQQIAEMGSTGYSTGPHLHFEVHPTGRGAVNPMALLPRG